MATSRSSQVSSFNTIIILLLGILRIANSLQISFCSPDNTGEFNGASVWPFQSNGHCEDTCKYQYAYGVLQGNNCWCTNFAPYDQVDNSECSVPCPGFPSELCGNQGKALYGYYHLTIDPSGTLGAPASTSTTQKPPATVTVLATVTTNLRPLPMTSDITTSSSPSTSTTVSTKTTTTSRFIPSPSTIITTVQGSIQTVTVTPTVPPSAGETGAANDAPVAVQDPFWSSTAKVAGTFTAVAVVIIALLAIIVFLLWRRRKSNESEHLRSVSDHDGTSTTGQFFGSSTEKRHSRLGLSNTITGGRGGSNERTPTMGTPASMSRRHSQPLVHDQRLNPNALYAMGQDNGSHISVGSFQDNQDYSRPVLHVRNPDSE